MAEYKVGGILNQPESLSVDLINDREEERSNGVGHQVFGNSLIMELICSYVSSEADLRNLRLVNHTFQSAAAKRLRRVHKEIFLYCESRIQTLIDLTKSRDALNLTPFPFTSFEVSLDLRLETLETFGKTVGRHITRYSFSFDSGIGMKAEQTTKVVMLLSHSTELVALEIVSSTGLLLTLTKQDLDRFPSTFPRLTTLGISGILSNFNPENETENLYPLVDLLIIRTPRLQKVYISHARFSSPLECTRVLRSFVRNRPKNLPHFSLEVNRLSILFLDEVMDMDLTFTDLTISTCGSNEEQGCGMIRRLFTWLDAQTNSLLNLSIDIFLYEHQVEGPFLFPELLVLKNLKLTFPYPVTHIVGNPFPSLRKLCLEYYREKFALFGKCSMPSVQELHLCNQRGSLPDPSWLIRFPNLITLHIEFDVNMGKVFLSVLRYILTHLTQLENLDLDIREAYQYANEPSRSRVPISWLSWNLLTGGAPKSFRKLIWSDQDFARNNVGATQERVNGIYTVPSLSNMKNLKTFRIFPRLKSNLDAIVYMSRKGLLCPLQKLVLCSLPRDKETRLTEGEKTAYKEVLLNVHHEVVLWN